MLFYGDGHTLKPCKSLSCYFKTCSKIIENLQRGKFEYFFDRCFIIRNEVFFITIVFFITLVFVAQIIAYPSNKINFF